MNPEEIEAWRYMIGGALIGVTSFGAVMMLVGIWFVVSSRIKR